MKFTFLGTSAGTPTKARNVTALALEYGEGRSWYLFDCGEATQHQLLHTRLSLVKLRAVFITHVHGDHTFGLPGLIASASMAGRTEPLAIIGPAPVKLFIETALASTDSNVNYELQFIDVSTTGFYWDDGAVRISATALSHRVPCFGYLVEERRIEKSLLIDKLVADGVPPSKAWGQLHKGEDVTLEDGRHFYSKDYTQLKRRPRKVIIGGDNDKPELLHQVCSKAHLLIHEATYTQAVSDHVGPAPQHSSAEQVARFAQAVGLPNLILTHFSARYQFSHDTAPLIDEIAAQARKFYRGNLHRAKDVAEFELRKDFTLIAF